VSTAAGTALLIGALTTPAWAQPAPDAARSEVEAGADTEPIATPIDPAVAARLQRLEEDNQRLRDELDAVLDQQAIVTSDLERLRPLIGRVSGYLDAGFFRVSGDGSGIRSDTGHRYFPEYAGVVPDSWVFMGDPLSTAINARGEPADTSESRAITFDGVDAGDAPTFLLNTANLSVFGAASPRLMANLSVDLVPRRRDVSDPDGLFVGDYLDVKLGYVEYRPRWKHGALSLFAGKFDSVLGIEYRSQDAPDRVAVTPSLICRYTCGHPIGVKARAELLDDTFTVNVAVTNGSHVVEGFPFSDEAERNDWKTVAGRVSYRYPIGAGLELGASGAFGAQDLQRDDDVYQWHYGADLRLEWHDLEVSAEIVKGKAQGRTEDSQPPCGLAPCLDFKGAYGLVGYRATNALMPYLRVDWRAAVHQSGASFVYVSDLARATIGLRTELGTATVIKVEYTVNRELGRAPQFANDVLTSSLVLRF